MTDSRYKSVSIEAKFLYGLLLDRMGLSIKNSWMDADGRVYIYFTQEEAMDLMNCGKDKTTKLFRELERIGLIERRKQGQGRPARIYVKKFISPSGTRQPQTEQTPPPCPHQAAESRRSGQLDNTPPLTAEKPQSGLPESGCQHSDFSVPNKTDKKKTEWNDTDLSTYPPTPAPSVPAGRTKHGMRMDEMDRYRELIKENIDYDLLLAEHPNDAETLEGYVELMVEVCCSQRDFIRIAGDNRAADVVRSRFLKLNHDHIDYVLDSLNKNTTLIKNI